MTTSAPRVEEDAGGVRLWVKAVPGASRDVIAGCVGDRLKIRVSAPPEGGKANKAIVDLLAQTLGVKRRDIEIESGHTSPEKIIRVDGVTVLTVRATLRRS